MLHVCGLEPWGISGLVYRRTYARAVLLNAERERFLNWVSYNQNPTNNLLIRPRENDYLLDYSANPLKP